MNKTTKITYHPKYGTMVVKPNGLYRPPNNFTFGENVRIVPFDSTLKIKSKIHCELCNNPKPENKITDGYCDTCFRVVETSLKEELQQLRYEFKFTERRCTNFNMEGF